MIRVREKGCFLKFLTGRGIRQDQSVWVQLAAAVLVLVMGGSVLWAQSSQSSSQQNQGGAPAQAKKQQNQQTQQKQQPASKAPEKPEPLQLSTPQLSTPQLTTPEAPAPAKPGAKAQAQPAKPKQALVEAVEFRGNRRIPSSRLESTIFTRPGDVYNVNSLERDFMALWNSGYFDDIRLEVQDGKTGKIVIFFVREKKLVRAITYKGLHSVEQSDVLQAFQKQKVGLTMDSQYDPVVIKRAEVVLKDLLSSFFSIYSH